MGGVGIDLRMKCKRNTRMKFGEREKRERAKREKLENGRVGEMEGKEKDD